MALIHAETFDCPHCGAELYLSDSPYLTHILAVCPSCCFAHILHVPEHWTPARAVRDARIELRNAPPPACRGPRGPLLVSAEIEELCGPPPTDVREQSAYSDLVTRTMLEKHRREAADGAGREPAADGGWKVV